MSKNYMPEVTRMLSVELGERVRIEFSDGSRSVYDYYFDENGLRYARNPKLIKTGIMCKLLTGKIEIVRQPWWKPKCGKEYYCVDNYGGIKCYIFTEVVFDKAMLYMGNCFRTAEDAEKHKDEILAKFKEIEGE